jgi:hypothetical protein
VAVLVRRAGAGAEQDRDDLFLFASRAYRPAPASAGILNGKVKRRRSAPVPSTHVRASRQQCAGRLRTHVSAPWAISLKNHSEVSWRIALLEEGSVASLGLFASRRDTTAVSPRTTAWINFEKSPRIAPH